jgi:hypothetical protein
MAIAAFDDIKLLELRTSLERMWGDSQIKKNYTAKADTLNAILARQTASDAGTAAVDKDHDVAVKWLTMADQTVTTFDASSATGPAVCAIDGGELGADSKSYKLTLGTSLGFKIEETGSGFGNGLRGIDSTFAEHVNLGLLKVRKQLVEDANARVLAKLDTFTGTNKYMTATFKDDTTTPTGDTIIPAASYNARTVLPYLARVQMMNKYVDPYLLDGGLLFDDFYLSQLGSTGSDAIKLQNVFNQFDITQDMWGFSEASLDDRMYLVDKNAVAFFSKNHYTAQPRNLGIDGLVNYTMPLPELGNKMAADVVYQFKCENNKYYHVWKLILRYDLLSNPVIEDTDLTGVLAFRKGA